MAQDDGRDEHAARDAFERELTTDLKDTTPDRPRGWPLHTRILVGLAVGVLAGLLANMTLGGDHAAVDWVVRHVTEPVGALFLRALLMIVIPLIASSLIVGVAGIGDVRKLGRVGVRSFAYCFAISAISVLIGLTLANTIRPGERIRPETAEKLKLRYGGEAETRVAAATTTQRANSDSPLKQVVTTLVPANPFYAVSASETPQMLQLMFVALVVGAALTLLPEATANGATCMIMSTILADTA